MTARADSNPAEWDVSGWGPWPRVLANPVTDVEMRYEPFGNTPSDDGFWCRLITVRFGTVAVRFLLGEGQNNSASVEPSADNVAVLFPDHPLPDWL